MQKDEILTLDIEKLSNLGTGIARADGLVVFVENAVPCDKVRAKIVKVNKNFAAAEIVDILEPSEHRVKPFCPMQKVCGACQMQMIDYDYQLELKRQMVEDAIRKIGGLDIEIPLTIPGPEIKNYRMKVQYPVSQTKVSKRLLAGYYKNKTHEIVNIKYCPVHPEICDRIIDFIRNNSAEFNVSGYDEKTHTGDLRHIVLRVSKYSGKILLALVINSEKIQTNIRAFAEKVFDNFDEISGVCLNFNPKKTNVILGQKTECVKGCDFIEEKLLDKVFKIGADTFFQINPSSAENIFAYVRDYVKKNFQSPLILDAYAGISAFGICLSDAAEKVVTIEENPESCRKAEESLVINKINNVEIHSGDAAEFFKTEKRKFDVSIIDPPRKGCTKESLDEVLRLTKGKIIYVSCNPATLARDLKYLCEKGCRVISIQPFDMFCHTFHVENVAIIQV